MRKGAVALNTTETMMMVRTTMPVVRATAGSQRFIDRKAGRHLLLPDAVMLMQKLSNRCA